MRYPEDRLRFTADPLMCGVMDGAFLKDALRAMPHLRSVFVGFNWREAHGIGWDAIEAILSAVQLREFTIRSYMFCPRKAPARDLPLNHFALLTAFNYERISSQPPLHAEEQRQSLAIVLGNLHLSLERLRLPSDLAPISTIGSLLWPQLREFKLDGSYPRHLTTPLIQMLSGMPRLRELALLFALPWDMETRPLWPRDYHPHFSFPELEDLAISYPDPEDRLYSHLSPSLRRLSLRCCPHHCVHVWKPEECTQWHSPVQCASNLLHILSRIKSPLLQHLQLEYIADHADSALLRSIVASFPNLSSLEIHRFPENDHSDVASVCTLCSQWSPANRCYRKTSLI